MPRSAINPSSPLSTLVALLLAGCNSDKTAGPTVLTFVNNPCSAIGTVTLAEAQATRVDCGNGGTTVTLAGNGASYLVVPQFATDQGTNQAVLYNVASGNLSAPMAAASRRAAVRSGLGVTSLSYDGLLPPARPNAAQFAADRLLRARARQRISSGAFARSALRASGSPRPARVESSPPAGSVRTFQVLSSFSTVTWKTVAAQLAYAGANILVYVDTLAPANGFTPTQLQSFGQYFDQTLFPIDTTAFGAPSDVDGNGRVIVLMSPVVNGDTPSATCASQGFVAGFFNEEDFNGPTDPNSNQGEIFYSIVPDPSGTASCAHAAADVDFVVPAVFLHELQHLISFSQHVIVGGGNSAAGWLDEGLSIVAEELGSAYYEQQCPPPACRTNPAQLFPDSSQAFIQNMLYDSYQYALLPDTASVTLHDDSQFGFAWRGGAWLLMRWLGDHMGGGFYRLLERGPSGGVADIEAATGQPFPELFANFGLALYTDSLPGLPRTTAPAVDRFATRNVKQLWARLFATSGPSSDIPLAQPVQLFSITSDTSSTVMVPGTMTYFRLDTPASASTVTIRFAGPVGAPLAVALKAQLAIFRLPAGQ
jgi:hypothetical protein